MSKLQLGLVYHRNVSTDLTYLTSYELSDTVDGWRLHEALAQVAERHELPRSAFDLTGLASPEQVVLEVADMDVHEHALAALGAPEQ